MQFKFKINENLIEGIKFYSGKLIDKKNFIDERGSPYDHEKEYKDKLNQNNPIKDGDSSGNIGKNANNSDSNMQNNNSDNSSDSSKNNQSNSNNSEKNNQSENKNSNNQNNKKDDSKIDLKFSCFLSA